MNKGGNHNVFVPIKAPYKVVAYQGIAGLHFDPHHGRHVVPGTELSIAGERGRFRFVAHTVKGDAEWIDVIGRGKWRSFRPDRVRTVHRTRRAR